MCRLLLSAPLCLAISAACLAQSASPGSPPPGEKKSIAISDQDEVAALNADLQHMKATITAMQANLGFVGSTTSPVYHEIELNIDMWQTVIAQMQRRLDRLDKTREPSK